MSSESEPSLVEERAASSVVGVALMVGITIVAAAGLAVGVFEIGDVGLVVDRAQNVIECGRANC